MNEIIFHQHLKESFGSNSGDNFIQGMGIIFKVCNWDSFHKSLNQNRVFSGRLKGHGESHMFVSVEHAIELFQVVLLNVEINLVNQGFFHWVLTDGNL